MPPVFELGAWASFGATFPGKCRLRGVQRRLNKTKIAAAEVNERERERERETCRIGLVATAHTTDDANDSESWDRDIRKGRDVDAAATSCAWPRYRARVAREMLCAACKVSHRRRRRKSAASGLFPVSARSSETPAGASSSRSSKK